MRSESDGFGLRRPRLASAHCVLVIATWCFVAPLIIAFSDKARAEGDLPTESVWALAFGVDGSLWAGTMGEGLIQLGKDGHRQKYTKASTDGGLQDDAVVSLTFDLDGSLWMGKPLVAR